MSRFSELIIKKELSAGETEELRRIAVELENIINDLGTVIGPSGTVARLRAGSVVLDNAGMHTYLGGVETGRVEADGDFLLGSNIATAANTSFVVFSNAQTYNSESVGAGDLLMGDNTASKANVLWDKSAGRVLFRSGTTTTGYIGTDGSATFGAGDVVLNASGITLNQGDTATNQIKWIDTTGTDVYPLIIYATTTGSTPNRNSIAQLISRPETGGSGAASVVLHADGTSVDSYLGVGTGGFQSHVDHDASNTVDTSAFGYYSDYASSTADGFGQRHTFWLKDGSGALSANAWMDIHLEDVTALYPKARFTFSVNAGVSGGARERLHIGSAGMVVNDLGDDTDYRIETNNFPYAFGTDAGTDSITMALDVRGASGTAYPAVGINTPLPQQLFEVHKTTWDQVFDEEIADFDAVSPAWDKEVDAVGDFDAEVDVDGDLNDHADAAHDGAVGLEITFDDINAAYGTANLDAVDQTSCVASFWLHPNDVATGATEWIIIARGIDGAFASQFDVFLRWSGSEFGLFTSIKTDTTTSYGTITALTAAWHEIDLMWNVSSGSDDGFLYVLVDGVYSVTLSITGVDNDAQDVDVCRFGMAGTNATSQSGSFYMDTIKIDPVGAPFASKLAVKNGTYGLAVPVMDTTARQVQFTGPTNEKICTLEGWQNLDKLTASTNDSFLMWRVRGSGSGNDAFYVTATWTGSAWRLQMRGDDDAPSEWGGTQVTLASGWFHLRAIWGAASGAGADDGYGYLYVNGVLESANTGIDNDTHDVDDIYIGAPAGLDAGTYGIFYMDDCKWRSGDGLRVTGDGAARIDLPIRGATTLYRRYYHLSVGGFDPGASGATWVDPSANTTGGWQLNAVGETLIAGTDIHSDWDGVSDIMVEISFALNASGSANDTVDLKLVAYYSGDGDTATKTQTVEVATTTDGTQYKVYTATFTIDYDAGGNVVDVGDEITFVLNLETDTSEIDDIIITQGSFSYNTTHVGIESGDV